MPHKQKVQPHEISCDQPSLYQLFVPGMFTYVQLRREMLMQRNLGKSGVQTKSGPARCKLSAWQPQQVRACARIWCM